MADQRAVIVAPGIRDQWNGQAVLILVFGQSDAVALLRHHFANDPQPDLVVVVFHRGHQTLPPQSAAGRQRVGPKLRQWTLAHIAIAAEELLAVVVIPVLRQRERWRSLVAANFLLRETPDRLVCLHGEVPPNETGAVGEPVWVAGSRVFQQQPRRLDRVARSHDIARALEPPLPFAKILNAGDAVRAIRLYAADHREITNLCTRGNGTWYPCDQRALLRVG